MLNTALIILGLLGIGGVIARRVYFTKEVAQPAIAPSVVEAPVPNVVPLQQFTAEQMTRKIEEAFMQGKWQGVVDLAHHLQKRYPDAVTVAVLVMQSQAYFQMKEYSAAAIVYEDVLRVAPKDPEHHANVAQIQVKLRSIPRAVTHLMRALELDNTNSSYYRELADVLTMNKQHDEAREMLQKAAALEMVQQK